MYRFCYKAANINAGNHISSQALRQIVHDSTHHNMRTCEDIERTLKIAADAQAWTDRKSRSGKGGRVKSGIAKLLGDKHTHKQLLSSPSVSSTLTPKSEWDSNTIPSIPSLSKSPSYRSIPSIITPRNISHNNSHMGTYGGDENTYGTHPIVPNVWNHNYNDPGAYNQNRWNDGMNSIAQDECNIITVVEGSMTNSNTINSTNSSPTNSIHSKQSDIPLELPSVAQYLQQVHGVDIELNDGKNNKTLASLGFDSHSRPDSTESQEAKTNSQQRVLRRVMHKMKKSLPRISSSTYSAPGFTGHDASTVNGFEAHLRKRIVQTPIRKIYIDTSVDFRGGTSKSFRDINTANSVCSSNGSPTKSVNPGFSVAPGSIYVYIPCNK